MNIHFLTLRKKLFFFFIFPIIFFSVFSLKFEMEYQFVNCASIEKFKNLPQSLKKMAKDLMAKSHQDDVANCYPITQTNISLELADQLVTLIRNYSTNVCYDTHETVTDDEKLVNNNNSWFISDCYQDILMQLAGGKFEIFKELIETDISIRLKKCQGYMWIYFSSSNDSSKAIIFDITKHKT